MYVLECYRKLYHSCDPEYSHGIAAVTRIRFMRWTDHRDYILARYTARAHTSTLTLWEMEPTT